MPTGMTASSVSSSVTRSRRSRFACARRSSLVRRTRASSRAAPTRAISSRAPERLHQVVVGAGFEPGDARLLAGTRRDEDHRHVPQRRVGADRPQQLEAVEARHHHVGEQRSGGLAAHGGERGHAVADRLDAAGRRQQAGDVVAHVGIVVGDDDARPRGRRVAPAPSVPAGVRQPARRLGDHRRGLRHRRRGPIAGAAAAPVAACGELDVPAPNGIVTRNVEPCPGSLSTWTSPPWSRTSSRTSARPMPLPSKRAPAGAADAVEALEQVRQLGGGDAGAGVPHGEDGRVAVAAKADRDGAVEA